MSTKNCPETPRQKMIGMMYLVLTAMLALNVSADVLDAFTRVQEKMSSTVSGFIKRMRRLTMRSIWLTTLIQLR